VHAFEHHLAALVAQRNSKADDAAIVVLRFDRKHGKLRRHGIANKSRPLVTRFIAEHRDHRFGEVTAERRRAERAQAEQQQPVRQRRVPASRA